MAEAKVAFWVMLEAKPGKEKDVENFLRSGLAIVQEEPATIRQFVAIVLGFRVLDLLCGQHCHPPNQLLDSKG